MKLARFTKGDALILVLHLMNIGRPSAVMLLDGALALSQNRRPDLRPLAITAGIHNVLKIKYSEES